MRAKLPYPLAMLQGGESHDPFNVLGRHRDGDDTLVRAFMPSAEHVDVDGFGPMQRIPNTDIFECHLSPEQAAALPQHYRLTWTEKGDKQTHSAI